MAATLVLSLAMGQQAAGITWRFDGTAATQGWVARENLYGSTRSSSTLQLLRSEVVDGVWRVQLPTVADGERPTMTLVSPRLDLPASLFDRVEVRLRRVGGEPVQASFRIEWRRDSDSGAGGGTAANGLPELRFQAGASQVLTGAGCTFTVSDLDPQEVTVNDRVSWLAWDGQLTQVSLTWVVGESGAQGPWPDALEIESIRLTGVAEQLQGELDPPVVDDLTPFGELLGAARFHGFGQVGIQHLYFFEPRPAALGDVDGDGFPDLVTPYHAGERDGWLWAGNDGAGGFRAEASTALGTALGFHVTDLNGDGTPDIVHRVGPGNDIQVTTCDGARQWTESQRLEALAFLDMADTDADGILDLLALRMPIEFPHVLLVYRGVGDGTFAPPLHIAPEPTDEDVVVYRILPPDASAPYRSRALWGRLNIRDRFFTTYLDADGQVVRQPLELTGGGIDTWMIRAAADIDADGDVDLAVSERQEFTTVNTFGGLSWWMNDGGRLTEAPWLDDVELSADAEAVDLNGDGRLDLAFTDTRAASPAVVVALGVEGGLPVVEGRYPLEGQGGSVVPGDVDGDGDIDLVILERNVDGQGGVHVLLNRLDRVTAVAEGADALPARARLVVAGPNPFNGSTRLRLAVPAGDWAQVRVYNVLGQPVRSLVAGGLPPGEHEIAWDGRGDAGRALGSGVYLVTAWGAGWRRSVRAVKVE